MEINDYKVLEIIEKIKNFQIDIVSSKKEIIEKIIEYNSPDDGETIFDEFLDYIKENKNYNKNLEEYIEENYSDYFIKIKNIYFLQLRGKIDKLSIKKLIDISKIGTNEELIEFCDNYNIHKIF